jgi:hypothetical protein
MTQFLYAFGSIIYQILTLWLAMLGVLVLFDAAVSKLRRYRRPMEPLGNAAISAAVLVGFALLAAAVDTYILSPTLGAGINFFFAG